MGTSNKSLLHFLVHKLDATPGLYATTETKFSSDVTEKFFDNIARSMASTLLRMHFEEDIPTIRKTGLDAFVKQKLKIRNSLDPQATQIKKIISDNYAQAEKESSTTCSKNFDKHMRNVRVKIVKMWSQLLHGRPRHIFIDSMSFLRWDLSIHQTLIQSGSDEVKNCVLGMIGL